MSILPNDAKLRKTYPLYSGCLAYFPDALLLVSKNSHDGNEQHHPGTPLQWDKNKSKDELDALLRHIVDEEWDKVAWRALANLQRKVEAGWMPCSDVRPAVKDSLTVQDDPPEVRAGLPKLPDGWVYYGLGPIAGAIGEGEGRLGMRDVMVCSYRTYTDGGGLGSAVRMEPHQPATTPSASAPKSPSSTDWNKIYSTQ